MLGLNFPKLDSVLVQRGRGCVQFCLKASFSTLLFMRKKVLVYPALLGKVFPMTNANMMFPLVFVCILVMWS